MEEGRTGFDFIGFLQELEDALGSPVDVVQVGALHWYMRDRVLAEAVSL
jgi:predicted nucleotidyltransferase